MREKVITVNEAQAITKVQVEGNVMPNLQQSEDEMDLGKFVKMDPAQKNLLHLKLIFSGIHPVDFYLPSVMILAPERYEDG